MAGISPAAWKTKTQAPIHLLLPESVSEERMLFFVAPMINGLLVSTTEGHHSGEENKMSHAWSCEVLWLFVNWAKGMTHRNQGNVCCRHSSGLWWPILSKRNTVFHTLLSIFSSCFILSLWTHFSICKTLKMLPNEEILDMNLWACLR